MEKVTNRYKILFLCLTFTALIVHFLEYDTYNASATAITSIEGIPTEFAGWKGRDIALEENIYEILETRSIIHRMYYKGNQQVFLSLVYYPETKVDFHAPEACLSGSAIKIVKSLRDITVKDGETNRTIHVNQLLYERATGTDLVYYFFKSGDFLGNSYIKLRLQLALNKFGSQSKSGSLIRLSTPIPIASSDKANELLTAFISDLLPYVNKYL